MVFAMKPTHINLKTGQIKTLKAIAKRTGAPVAELVRRAVDEFIQRQGLSVRFVKRFTGKKNGGRQNRQTKD